MLKKIALLIIAFNSITAVKGQTIKIDFAHFAGKEYTYMLIKGDRADTLATGKLDKEGKTTLIIPSSKKGYVGMSRFFLTEGGGLDIIVNHENMTIRCTEAQPDLDNIKYIGSPENEFLIQQYKKEQDVLEKATIINAGLKKYNKTDALYPEFEIESRQLDQKFTALQTSMAQSPLYAARFRQMNNYLMGIGSQLNQTEAEKATDFAAFFRSKLNVEALYTSNLWSPLIDSWMQMQQSVVKDDAVLLSDAKQILSRIKDKAVFTAFADKLVVVLAKAGKDPLVDALGDYAAKSGKIQNPGSNLMRATTGLTTGTTPPKLHSDKGQIKVPGKTLLLFYESGCNNCENEIHQLLGNYEILQQKGYNVISIAADMTANSGNEHNHAFPWKEQLCDYKGFSGANFVNYGIIGTPTFFVIDAAGKIEGRYARLIDTKLLSENKK